MRSEPQASDERRKGDEALLRVTLIRNATIVTGDAGRTIHHGGAIAVDGDRIAAVGPTADVERRFPGAEIVDGRGKAVFPGFVNCPTHLWFTVARGIQEDFGFLRPCASPPRRRRC